MSSIWTAVALLFTGSLLGHMPAGGRPAPAGAEASSVRKVADAYVAAVLRGDATGVARLFTEDGVEMPPCAPRAAGRAAVEQYYRHLFERPGRITAFTLEPGETQVEGDVAYEAGGSRQTISRGPALPPLEIVGKYLVVLRRTGREWRVAYAIYNGDEAPPGVPGGAGR
jgi:uncharacterized protein (TIGR02246 family)